MILLGTLTVSGFAPLDYTPPSVPIIKPTPSDALFYEIEDDPRGRWWLDHPVAANGDEDDLPFGIGTWCEPINVPTPLRFRWTRTWVVRPLVLPLPSPCQLFA